MAKTDKTDKKNETFEEKVSEALEEGFDLGDLLDGVKVATAEVKVFLDSETAYKAIELNARLEDIADRAAKKVRTITDVEDPIEVDELVALRDAMEESAITFVLRALSNAELNVVKKTVAHSHPIKKNLPADEETEARNERGEIVNEHLLAVACVEVRRADGKSNPGLTIDDAHRLRETLPSTEWDRLTEGVLTAMTRAQVADRMMAEPTFRWADAVAE